MPRVSRRLYRLHVGLYSALSALLIKQRADFRLLVLELDLNTGRFPPDLSLRYLAFPKAELNVAVTEDQVPRGLTARVEVLMARVAVRH